MKSKFLILFLVIVSLAFSSFAKDTFDTQPFKKHTFKKAYTKKTIASNISLAKSSAKALSGGGRFPVYSNDDNVTFCSDFGYGFGLSGFTYPLTLSPGDNGQQWNPGQIDGYDYFSNYSFNEADDYIGDGSYLNYIEVWNLINPGYPYGEPVFEVYRGYFVMDQYSPTNVSIQQIGDVKYVAYDAPHIHQ